MANLDRPSLLARLTRRALHSPPLAATWRAGLDRFAPVDTVVFVATTGRSGTGLLASLLGQAEGTVALHEPVPVINGRAVAERNTGRHALARRLYWQHKSLNVRRAGAGRRLYAETNHMFIKSFADWATEDFGDRLRVVHLRRDRIAVARSIYSLGVIPDQGGRHWYLDYRARGNLLKMARHLEGDALSHDFFKCLWYWHEIEARVAAYKRRFPHIEIVEVDFRDLLTTEGAAGLIRALGLLAPEHRIAQVLETPVNQKVAVKAQQSKPLAPDDAHRMAEGFDRLLNEVEPDSRIRCR